MALLYKGQKVTAVKWNGQNVTQVNFNKTKVWPSEVVFKTPHYNYVTGGSNFWYEKVSNVEYVTAGKYTLKCDGYFQGVLGPVGGCYSNVYLYNTDNPPASTNDGSRLCWIAYVYLESNTSTNLTTNTTVTIPISGNWALGAVETRNKDGSMHYVFNTLTLIPQ